LTFRGPRADQTRTKLAATNIDVQFPILSRAVIPENRLTVSVMISTPPSNSWCGIDLEPGLVVIYGPGVEHTAVNPVGTRFVFAVVDLPALQRLAASMKLDLDPPRRGEVALLHPAPETRAFTDCLRRLFRTDESRVEARRVVESDLLYAIVRCLRSSRRKQRLSEGTRVDSRRVTIDCIDYAETTGRIPSVEEMCMTSHVSERRLRIAFAESYAMPPTQVLRMWAMAKANEQLRAADPSPGIEGRHGPRFHASRSLRRPVQGYLRRTAIEYFAQRTGLGHGWCRKWIDLQLDSWKNGHRPTLRSPYLRVGCSGVEALDSIGAADREGEAIHGAGTRSSGAGG